MTLKRTLCACAIALGAIAAPALAQGTEAALAALYRQAVDTNTNATTATNAATEAFNGNDASSGCNQIRSARQTYGQSRIAMEGIRETLRAATDISADDAKQILDWVDANEPVVDDDMRQIDGIVADRCEAGQPYSTASIDRLLDAAGAVMSHGLAANRDAREAFERDDVDAACDALEIARRDHEQGYAQISEARTQVQSNHDLPASVQRQYFDVIDNTQRESEGLATTMAELWRNRCSSR